MAVWDSVRITSRSFRLRMFVCLLWILGSELGLACLKQIFYGDYGAGLSGNLVCLSWVGWVVRAICGGMPLRLSSVASLVGFRMLWNVWTTYLGREQCMVSLVLLDTCPAVVVSNRLVSCVATPCRTVPANL